jgi:hypothetical protein
MRFAVRPIENKLFTLFPAAAALALALTAFARLAPAQNSVPDTHQAQASSSRDRWLHVRVTNPDSKDETVKVNVPLELAEKVLPAINHDRLHNGKVRIEDVDCHGVDIHALLDALRTSKDGEFVTVQNHDNDVRVAKQNGYMFVHVYEHAAERVSETDQPDHSQKRHGRKSEVEVKIPMKVVDALFSSGKDELDLLAGLRALAAQGDTELVSVKDRENSVRVWLDSKNISD